MIGSFSWKQKLPRARLDIQSCSSLVYTSVGAIWDEQFKTVYLHSVQNYHLQLLINRWTFSNPHQLFWSTSVEVDKAGFPALKEDFVPSAKLASCYIQVLNSNKIELKRLPKKKIQSRRIASRQDWISGKYFCSAKSRISNLKWG